MATGDSKDIKKARAEARAEKEDRESILKVLEASGLYSKEQLESIKTRIGDSENTDWFSFYENASAELAKTPEGRARRDEILSQRKAERLSTKLGPFLQAGLGLSDIATSLGQIQRSNTNRRAIVQPTLPTPGGIDPVLQNSIAQAQRGTMDAARVAAPAQQQLQDQYSKDIALAKSIGGGQASTVGALGQVASLRRARGAASLIPMIDSVRAREQGRADNLLGMRLNQQNINFNNQLNNSRIALDQYDKNIAAAGNLGSVGRSNLRGSMQSLLGTVPGIAARMGGNRGGYNDKYSQYEQALNSNLTNGPKVANPYSNISSDDDFDYIYNLR